LEVEGGRTEHEDVAGQRAVIPRFEIYVKAKGSRCMVVVEGQPAEWTLRRSAGEGTGSCLERNAGRKT
jgi:hypothetical protein